MPNERSRLHLTVSPGARRDEVTQTGDGQFRIRVAAPAVEGKANKRLVMILAEWLEVAPSRVRVVRGANSRHKAVEIEGLTLALVIERLGSVSTAS